MQVEIKTEPKIEGRASSVVDAEVRGPYAETVAKFVKDNENLGKDWQNMVLDLLLKHYKVRGSQGELRGSNPYMATMLAQSIPLIGLEKLRKVYAQNKILFPESCVETGLLLTLNDFGEYLKNHDLAMILEQDFVKKGFNPKDRIPNFTQMRLAPCKNNGLVFLLNDLAIDTEIPNLGDYTWRETGKGGLFRAFLYNGYDWCASEKNLWVFSENSSVVRYDAESIAKESEHPIDPIEIRILNFKNA